MSLKGIFRWYICRRDPSTIKTPVLFCFLYSVEIAAFVNIHEKINIQSAKQCPTYPHTNLELQQAKFFFNKFTHTQLETIRKRSHKRDKQDSGRKTRTQHATDGSGRGRIDHPAEPLRRHLHPFLRARAEDRCERSEKVPQELRREVAAPVVVLGEEMERKLSCELCREKSRHERAAAARPLIVQRGEAYTLGLLVVTPKNI